MLNKDDSFLSLFEVSGTKAFQEGRGNGGTRHGTSTSNERCDATCSEVMKCRWPACQSDGVTLLVVKTRLCMAWHGMVRRGIISALSDSFGRR